MTTTPAIPRPRPPREPRAGSLPGVGSLPWAGSLPEAGSLPWAGSVLAVTARPGQESADLGGLLYAFRRSGASLSLLCLTRGEAAGRNSGPARLEAIRPWEVQLAATVLGISAVGVASYRDGELPEYPAAVLAERIGRALRERSADLLIVVAPEAGDRSDAAVARAALAAAAAAGVPVVGATRPGARGAWTIDLGADAEAARASQRSAAAAHASQSEALPAAGPARPGRDAALAAAAGAGPGPARRQRSGYRVARFSARRQAARLPPALGEAGPGGGDAGRRIHLVGAHGRE